MNQYHSNKCNIKQNYVDKFKKRHRIAGQCIQRQVTKDQNIYREVEILKKNPKVCNLISQQFHGNIYKNFKVVIIP